MLQFLKKGKKVPDLSRTTEGRNLQTRHVTAVMHERESVSRSDGLAEDCQAVLLLIVAKTPDVSLHFCGSGYHLWFPWASADSCFSHLTCRDVVSSWEIWFQSIQMVELYLLCLSLCLRLRDKWRCERWGGGDGSRGNWGSGWRFHDRPLGFWCVWTAVWAWWLRGTMEVNSGAGGGRRAGDQRTGDGFFTRKCRKRASEMQQNVRQERH